MSRSITLAWVVRLGWHLAAGRRGQGDQSNLCIETATKIVLNIWIRRQRTQEIRSALFSMTQILRLRTTNDLLQLITIPTPTKPSGWSFCKSESSTRTRNLSRYLSLLREHATTQPTRALYQRVYLSRTRHQSILLENLEQHPILNGL